MEELDQIKREVQQYVALKHEIDQLNDRVTTIKKRLTGYAEANGVPNEKGSLVFDVNDELTKTSAIVKQRRVTKTFNDTAAEEILKARGLYDTCIKTTTVLDEDAVMGAYYNGELTDDDIDTMFPEKVVWALVLEKSA